MLASDIEDIYRLTPLQQGMLFHELAEPGAGLYLLHRGYEIRGELDTEVFLAAWERAADRHTPLRTSFNWKDVDEPVQIVHRDRPAPVVREDWSRLGSFEQESRMRTLDKAQQRPFDLEQAPLMRLALVRLANDLHYFTWTFHHILLEGWSAAIILDEVVHDYDASVSGRSLETAERRPFREYVAWLGGRDQNAARRFWSESLDSFSAPNQLIAPGQSGDGGAQQEKGEARNRLPADSTRRLQDLARKRRLTLNTVVQGAWAILLSRHVGRDDVLFGTTVSGRSADFDGIEEMVGLFINTIPCPVRVDRSAPTFQWLSDLQAAQVRAREYEWCSLVDIHGWSKVPRTAPLFESIVVFSNWAGNDRNDWTGALDIRSTHTEEGGTGYPLTLMVSPGEELGLSLGFDSRATSETEAGRLLRHLRAILENMADHPDAPVGEISMVSPEERERILSRNPTGGEAPTRPVHRLVEDRADLDPHRTAVTARDGQLSYGELDEQANSLARFLMARGASEGEVVGVCLERTTQLIVSLLAVMKAGAAYLPLDPGLPKERLDFMTADAQSRLVLCDGSTAGLFEPTSLDVIDLEAHAAAIAAHARSRLPEARSPRARAYVIYTSGSTGRPKGVEVEHDSFTNLLLSMQERPGFADRDTLLAVTTISFDISGLEIFLPLVSGGRVVLADEDVSADAWRLAATIRDSNASVMQATPATWRLLLDSGWSGKPDLKILCGGEAFPRELADRILPLCGGLWNMYGPTETTIWSTVAEVRPDDRLVPIGTPIANTSVYVLDEAMALVPDTVRGELYIGGAGVARGYLHRPELTAERFIPNPFSDGVENDRIYRTGDVARWLDDGRLECLGRRDHQLKVRGFRIEPGEIESVLCESEAVRDSVVVGREFGPGDVRLIAYVVPEGPDEPLPSELRWLLRRSLPDYMIPNIFTFLEALPLNTSGKVDRNALPDPTRFRTQTADTRPPQTDSEKVVASVWQDILGVDAVHADDNFFDLGGHSLLAIQVTARVERELGRSVNPMKLAFLNLSQFAAECETRSGVTE